MIFGAHTLRAKHDVTAMELGPAWRRLGIGGVRRERHSCSSSVADPRSQNAAARSQTAIPASVAPCAQLSVGLEQLTTGRRVLACALIAGPLFLYYLALLAEVKMDLPDDLAAQVTRLILRGIGA